MKEETEQKKGLLAFWARVKRDRAALDAIAHLLSGAKWDRDALSKIAILVESTNRVVE